MGHMSYEDAKKQVFVGFWILLGVTLIEVFFSLLGKGHIFSGAEDMNWIVWLTALIIVVLSIYKASYII